MKAAYTDGSWGMPDERTDRRIPGDHPGTVHGDHVYGDDIRDNENDFCDLTFYLYNDSW